MEDIIPISIIQLESFLFKKNQKCNRKDTLILNSEQPDSNTPSCRRDQILGQICDLLSERAVDNDTIACIEIYILKSDQPSIFYSYALPDGRFLDQLFVGSNVDKTITNAFMALRNIMKTSEKMESWNKARLLVINDDDYIYECENCEDVNWLAKVSPREIPNVDRYIEAQTKILSWDGIPKNEQRWWLKKESEA